MRDVDSRVVPRRTEAIDWRARCCGFRLRAESRSSGRLPVWFTTHSMTKKFFGGLNSGKKKMSDQYGHDRDDGRG